MIRLTLHAARAASGRSSIESIAAVLEGGVDAVVIRIDDDQFPQRWAECVVDAAAFQSQSAGNDVAAERR